jgi:hypothetical protein
LPDHDISHYVEERFNALEARVDALDGGPEQQGDSEEEDEDSEEEEPATPQPPTSRRGRRSTVTVPETEVDVSTEEGVSY